MAERPRFSYGCGFTAALAASMAVFTAPALADNCTKLSSVALPEVISITASSIAANSLTPPGLTAPVPVAFCRVQITVTPAINIEVWLPTPGNWNHRFQAEGGGGYAGVISYSALAMAVTGDAVTGQFATASTDTGHPATGTANGQGGANGAQAGGGFALNLANDTLNEELIVDFASRSLHEKSTSSRRARVALVGSHKRSAFCCWIASKRSAAVTGT
jgi:tannase/feruloyl esterase